MKRIFLTFGLMCIVFAGVQAQQSPFFRFGMTISPNLGSMRPDTRNYESEGIKLGFSYGAVGDFRLGDYYSISSGILVSHAGGKLSFTDAMPPHGVVEMNRTYSLSYLEVPLTLKMHTMQIGYFTYFGRFGFAPSFNISAETTTDFKDGLGRENSITQDSKDDIRFLRAALVIGIGTEYSLGGRTALLLGFTYNNGFSNVLKGDNTVSGSKQSAINNFFELNLGVMF
jgi:hypothetical protein